MAAQFPSTYCIFKRSKCHICFGSYSTRGHFLCVLSRLVRKSWVLLHSSDANSGHCTLITLVYVNFHHKHDHHLSKLVCLPKPLHSQRLWACQRTWLMYGHKLLCRITVRSNFGLADPEAFNVPGTLFVSSKPFLAISVTPPAGRLPSNHAQEAHQQHGPLWHDFQLREATTDDFFLYLEGSPLNHSEPSLATLPYHQSILILWLELFNISVTHSFSFFQG